MPKSLIDDLKEGQGRGKRETMVGHWRVYLKTRVSGEDPYTDEKFNDFLHPATIHHATSRDAAQQSRAKSVNTTRGA